MYTAIALFAIAIMVCLQNFVKPNDWQKNEKPNEHKKKIKAQRTIKTAESAENINAIYNF